MPSGTPIPPFSAQGPAPPKRSIPLEWGIGFGVVALFVILYLVSIIQNLGISNDDLIRKANPRVSENNAVFQSAEMLAHAPLGKIVFDNLRVIPGVNPNPQVMRQMGTPTLCLMVTEESWNKLSKEQQIDLTWYIQNLIPQVRGNPEGFLRDYKKNLPRLYDEHLEFNRNLCSDCWEIFIGEIGEDGAAASLSGRPLVKGDSIWNLYKSPENAAKASEFRKNTATKEVSK